MFLWRRGLVSAVSAGSLATSSTGRTSCVTSETSGFRAKLSFFFCFSTDCNRERFLYCDFPLMKPVWFESGPGSLNTKSPELQGFFRLTAPFRTIQTANSKNPAHLQTFSPIRAPSLCLVPLPFTKSRSRNPAPNPTLIPVFPHIPLSNSLFLYLTSFSVLQARLTE